MKTLNSVTLIGNLGSDPKIITSESQYKFATFSLATQDRWKTKEGTYTQDTQWHEIVVFKEHLVSFVEKYLKKGDKIYLEGKLKSRTWTHNEGQEIKVFEIILPRYEGSITLLTKREAMSL